MEGSQRAEPCWRWLPGASGAMSGTSGIWATRGELPPYSSGAASPHLARVVRDAEPDAPSSFPPRKTRRQPATAWIMDPQPDGVERAHEQSHSRKHLNSRDVLLHPLEHPGTLGRGRGPARRNPSEPCFCTRAHVSLGAASFIGFGNGDSRACCSASLSGPVADPAGFLHCLSSPRRWPSGAWS